MTDTVESKKEAHITWGTTADGTKHYLCHYCEVVFGPVDIDTIQHECDTTKPRYHNRDRTPALI